MLLCLPPDAFHALRLFFEQDPPIPGEALEWIFLALRVFVFVCVRVFINPQNRYVYLSRFKGFNSGLNLVRMDDLLPMEAHRCALCCLFSELLQILVVHAHHV